MRELLVYDRNPGDARVKGRSDLGSRVALKSREIAQTGQTTRSFGSYILIQDFTAAGRLFCVQNWHCYHGKMRVVVPLFVPMPVRDLARQKLALTSGHFSPLVLVGTLLSRF